MPLSRDGTEVGSGTSCTTSAIDLFSVPSLHAKSPILTKAKIAVHSAVRRPRALPQNFALHGKRQARPSVSTKHSPNNVQNTVATCNPKPARSIVIPVEIGDLKEHSPRVCFMTEECGDVPANQDVRGDVDSFVSTAAHSPRALSESLTAAIKRKCPNHGFDQKGITTAYRQHMLQLCSPPNNTMTCAVYDGNENEDVRDFASSRGLPILEPVQADKVANQSTTTTTAAARCCRPSLLSDQSHHSWPQPRRGLRGRLWTGTTAPSPVKSTVGEVEGGKEAATSQERGGVHSRPKTLFLVSGQGRGPGSAFVGCHQQHHHQPTNGKNCFSSNAGTIHHENGRRDHRYTNDRKSRASSFPAADANPRQSLSTAIISSCSKNAKPMIITADMNNDQSNALAPSTSRMSGWDWNRADGGINGTKYINSKRRGRTLSEPSRENTRSDTGESDGDDCTVSYISSTAESNATEDGGGGGAGGWGGGDKIALHIGVPRAPPTSLLVLKFPPSVPPSP